MSKEKTIKELPKRIGIIGAMAVEVEAILPYLSRTATTEKAGLTFYAGTMNDHEVVVVRSGVGKVYAAICAQMLIDLFHVDAICNVGMGGGLAPELQVGDVVVATALVQHDFDLTPFGHVKGYMGLEQGGTGTRPTYYQADADLVARCVQGVREKEPAQHCYTGVIASGDVFVADDKLKKQLHEQFGALVAEMEGAAMAQTAYVNGVPFMVLRTVSDLAEGHAEMTFEQLAPIAAERAACVLDYMLQ